MRLETARISIALAIHSFDPTGNACRDLEIAPTNVGTSVRLETAPTGKSNSKRRQV